MIKELKYNGYTANPSDYECQDGDLSVAINFVPEEGALRTVLPPKVEEHLEEGAEIVYVHQTANFKNYIIRNGSSFMWRDASNITAGEKSLHYLSGATFYQANSVGNTLLMLTSNGMYYFLFKDDEYISLGNHLPECDLSFGLQATMEKSGDFEISFDNINQYSVTNEFTENNKNRVTDQVLAQVNKFIAEKATNSNKFMYPFFVRYAYRLYDGSLTMHSAPILMICSAKFAPQVYVRSLHGKDNNFYNANVFVCAALHQLDYAVNGEYSISMLKNWSDIISSIDIFISAPIYTYDQNGKCQRFIDTQLDDDYSICKHINQKSKYDAKYPLRYQYKETKLMYCFTFEDGTMDSNGIVQSFNIPKYRVELPRKHVDKIKDDIISKSLFYFISSCKVEELSTTRKIIPIKNEFLKSLQTHEIMSDDYRSHDKIIPKHSFVYNSRLNLSGISTEIFNGFDNGQSYSNGNVGFTNFPTGIDYTVGFDVYIFINENGRKIVVRSSIGIGLDAPLLFFFYPNTNAYKLVAIPGHFNVMKAFEVPLTPHEMMNGAFYFAGFGLDDKPEVTSQYQTTDRIVSVPNKIYTSEVNNPFSFPVTGINTIGTGSIMGICSAAKALSEGQFGQFPLYAFTSEGVWALEVSATGSYSAKQPITRDVCVDADSITQIDSAVLFATDRGIMLLSGSTSTCISDVVNSSETFTFDTLPKFMNLISSKLGNVADGATAILPFNEFLKGCRMLYDYSHQRIIVFNPEYEYAYIYSLKSKGWGMMLSNFSTRINSYPEALAMNKNGDLVNFSVSDVDKASGVIITRPFKLDDPNMFKTIDTIIQRGFFKRDNLQQVLYGSNDLFNWHAIWSSSDKYLRGFRGTPYKAFRLALVCKLDKSESLFGCTVQFSPRRLNQPR